MVIMVLIYVRESQAAKDLAQHNSSLDIVEIGRLKSAN
jgi:hypothetical protein